MEGVQTMLWDEVLERVELEGAAPRHVGPYERGCEAGWVGRSRESNPFTHPMQRIRWERGRIWGLEAQARYLNIAATKGDEHRVGAA